MPKKKKCCERTNTIKDAAFVLFDSKWISFVDNFWRMERNINVLGFFLLEKFFKVFVKFILVENVIKKSARKEKKNLKKSNFKPIRNFWKHPTNKSIFRMISWSFQGSFLGSILVAKAWDDREKWCYVNASFMVVTKHLLKVDLMTLNKLFYNLN